MSKQARNPVKSVETTFEILNALMELGGAGVTELADHLSMPKSTVYNYLGTLEQEEYVVNQDGTYRVGIRFLEFGGYARHRKELFDIAKPEVDRLTEETGELANVMVEEHGMGSYLYRARGDKAVQVKAHVGNRVKLHTTGLGKAILAHLPEERVDEIIDRRGLDAETEYTITDRDELFDELEQIREEGVAYDDEERLKGLRCVAAPVIRDGEGVLGAVSVAGPMNRLQDERFREDLAQRVLEAVNVIELNVTHSQ